MIVYEVKFIEETKDKKSIIEIYAIKRNCDGEKPSDESGCVAKIYGKISLEKIEKIIKILEEKNLK
jgi:hypothetical protein